MPVHEIRIAYRDTDDNNEIKSLVQNISAGDGDEAIHSLLDVMYARKPYTVISRAVHIHPTVAELIPTVLQEMTALE